MKQLIQKDLVNGQNFTKEHLERGLRADLNMVLTLVHDLLSDQDLFNAVLESYWKKTQDLIQAKDGKEEPNAQP